jgi:hypothetical protein
MNDINAIIPPRPLTFSVMNGHGEATFGPELKEYIQGASSNIFPVVDESGNVLHSFYISDALRTEMADL